MDAGRVPAPLAGDRDDALERDEEIFRRLADQMPGIVWRTTAEGITDYLNDRWYEYTGLERGQLGEASWVPFLHPDDLDETVRRWARSLAREVPFEMEYRIRGRDGAYRWQLGRTLPVLDDYGFITHWIGTCTDIDDRRRAEAQRREDDERHRFILGLSDRLRTLSDPVAIMGEASATLGEALAAARVSYGEVDEALDEITAERDWTDGKAHSITGRFRLSSFGPALVEEARAGRTVVVRDVASDVKVGADRDSYLGLGIHAFVSVPLVKAGSLQAALSVHQDEARDWLQHEVALIEEVAERTWAAVAQARAEEALREETRRLEALNRAGAILSGELDLDRLIEALRAVGADLVGASASAYFDEAGIRLGGDHVLPHPEAVVTGARGIVVCRTDITRKGAGDGPVGVRAYLAVPISSRGREQEGWLAFGHAEPGRFASRHAKLAAAVAAQAAIAIDNAHLYQAAQQEIAERRAAEARSAVSDARFSAITKSVEQLIWSADAEGRTDYYNDSWHRFTGLPQGHVDGPGWDEVIHPVDAPRVAADWRDSVASGAPFRCEYRLRRHDGVYRWVVGRGERADVPGSSPRWYGSTTDVDDLKVAETELVRAHAMTRAVMEAVPGFVYAKDREGRFITANRGTTELVGRKLEDIIGRTDRELLDDRGEAETVMANDRRIIESETPETLEERVSRSDSGPRFWLSTKAPFRDAGGHVVGLVGASLDITDRKRDEQRLRALNEDLEQQVAARTAERDRVWQRSRDILIVIQTDGTIRAVNPAWEHILGYRALDVIGQNIVSFVWPEAREGTRITLAEAAVRDIERIDNRYAHRDGSVRWLRWSTFVEDGLIYAYGRDITADRAQAEALSRTEEALRQAQKMETVGQLTGGIAHDFNNLLQIITGNLDRLMRNLPAEAPRLRRAAENAMTGAHRAATLTQRLLAFSRRQPLAPRAVDIGELVGGMRDLLRRTLGEVVSFEASSDPRRWWSEVDPHQLENAILNLAVNARDAMPGGGTLGLTIEAMLVDEPRAGPGGEIGPGDYVGISITDTGVGMDEATMARAFEPFFTTKDVGKGTGLGLSMVYGFAKQSGGHVAISSRPGEGTRVTVMLPRLAACGEGWVDALRSVPDEPGADEIMATCTETILTVEDDDDVRIQSVESLREMGYRVIEAHDAELALRLLERQGAEVDLLFSDVVLPGGTNGEELARRAIALRPRLKVLFTTGYPRDAIMQDGRVSAGVALISKPFSFQELARKVRAALDQKDEPGSVPDGGGTSEPTRM